MVYFSELLPNKHPVEWKLIQQVIHASEKPDVTLLKSTKDIWCRDYMPVVNTSGKLIQFRYEPSYLKSHNRLRSNPRELNRANGIKTIYSSINLDGGNVITKGERAIITDRVVIENPEYSNKYRLFKEIEELLEVELIVMPCYSPKVDMTGHIDGMMRWADENTLIGNDLAYEEKWLSQGITTILKEHDLDYISMPFYQDKSTAISTIGIYVNYLELEDVVLFPIFGQKEKVDNKAIDAITKSIPHKKVVPIDINGIAKEGGLMNCISWSQPVNLI